MYRGLVVRKLHFLISLIHRDYINKLYTFSLPIINKAYYSSSGEKITNYVDFSLAVASSYAFNLTIQKGSAESGLENGGNSR